MSKLREVFLVLNDMRSQSVVDNYALGGAMAAVFYAEPTRTYDLDVFVLLKEPAGTTLTSLSPVYEWLEGRGFRPDAEHVLIHGVPVRLLPAFNDLVRESLAEARTLDYDGIPVRVVDPEHLCALAIQAGGRRRRERAWQIIESGAANQERLAAILRRHGLRPIEESS